MIEYNELSIVICTNKKSEQYEETVQTLYDRAGCPVHVFICNNSNNVALTQVYQQMLDKKEINKNIILYMHDDVDILTVNFGRKILDLFKNNIEYGIIGVAGSKQFDENASWWSYDKKYGQVVHHKDTDGRSWLSAFSNDLEGKIENVLMVDGLFFAIDPTKIKSGFNVRLPEFDFYDATFCIDNAIQGVKIGVTTDIRVCHHSLGNMRENWYKNREILNHLLYGKYYPMDIDEGIKEKNDDVESYLKIKYEEIREKNERDKERNKA